MTRLGNVYCVGRNYGLHAAELGNAVPDSPMIFMKPTHAVTPMDGSAIKLSSEYGIIHYEAELVIRIGTDYEPGAAAGELVDGFVLGLDLTMRELQDELKKKQHPWIKAKGFIASAPLTAFRTISTINELAESSFTLTINGAQKQKGHIGEMIFDIPTLIDHIGSHYGLRSGDVIFTGTPAGVGRIDANDQMQLYWGADLMGECTFVYKQQ